MSNALCRRTTELLRILKDSECLQQRGPPQKSLDEGLLVAELAAAAAAVAAAAEP